MASRSQMIYMNWRDIQDIIGPAAQWPYEVRRLFWTSGLAHFQRILICTFCFVNGLNPLVFYEWAELMNLARDAAAWRHFHCLFR